MGGLVCVMDLATSVLGKADPKHDDVTTQTCTIATDLYNSNLYSHRLIQSGNRSFSPSPCRPSTTHLRLSYFIHHTFPTTLPQIVPLTCTAGAIYRGQLTYQPAHFGGKHTFTGKTCKLHTDSTKGLNLGRWNHETAVLYLHHCALCVVHL